MNSNQSPYDTLGLPETATTAEIRARYLELVKQNPPERDAVRFQQIHQAYQLAMDPLAQARALMSPPDVEEWEDVLNRHESDPPMLSTHLLLSLGNRSSEDSGE